MFKKFITAKDDFLRSSHWISNFLIREGYHIDYSLKSFLEIDKFIREKIYLIINDNNFIFSISTYIGEVLRIKFNGEWNIKDSSNTDSTEEFMEISFKNGEVIYPLNITLDIINNKYTLEYILKEKFDIVF